MSTLSASSVSVNLVSLDPGIRGSGTAFFVGNELLLASYVRNPLKRDNGPAECLAMAQAIAEWARKLGPVNTLVVEWPRIYTAGKQRSKEGSWRDPNDLLGLAAIGTATAALLPNVTVQRYFPDDWKKQVSKIAMNNRVEGRLSTIELARVEDAGALMHNIWDGIGIGLKALSRLEPKRIFPGAT